MLERDFKAAAFAWDKRGRGGQKHGARFAQNDLAKLVRKLDGELDIREREVARIRKIARKGGDFLIQKIFSTGESQVFNVKFRRVVLFGGAKREMRFTHAGGGTPRCARPHHDGESDAYRCGTHPRNPIAAAFWRRLMGGFDLQSVRHELCPKTERPQATMLA